MIQKQNATKILAILAGVSLLFTSPGLPAQTIQVKADTVTVTPESPEIRSINLNLVQEDGSYTIAGISDPGQPANSQTEASIARNNSWGQETDADGNVTKSGSYVYYGSYQQSSDGDGGYLTEPLKWRVLDADSQDFSTEDHTMFLMSDKVLDWVNFNENKDDGEQIYSICNLRKWLNSESFSGPYLDGGFLDNAFREPEQKAIIVSSKGTNNENEIEGFITIAKDNCGLSQGDVIDKIFVLSAEEANSNVYGFYHLPGFGGSDTKKLTATDYAASKEICSVTKDPKDWWLRSRVVSSPISGAVVDCMGYLYACNADGIYSNGSTTHVGVAPAFNMDLSSIRFTSASGTSKSSSFALTSASDSKEWNLTMAGGSGFTASRKTNESGAVSPGGEITVDIDSIGTPDSGVAYTQISAMLVDSNNTVIAYGKIADADVANIEVTIPDQVADGDYILKIFAEEINSSSQQNLTDFASNMVDIPITVGDSYTISITNPTDSHITYSTTEENGTEQQGILKDGGSYTKVVYNADHDYYFPENYNIAEINGIIITRDSFEQITVSGVPTGDVNLTLTAATEKDSQPAPEGLSESDGQITGTDTTMEYRIKPSAEGSPDTEWANCTAGFTAATPGIYQIRYKETDTKKTGEITEITVLTRYTITITNPADSHITRSEAADNGTEQQKTTDEEAITSIAYTAEDGYYFPDDYSVTGQNGITVTRDSDTQITVSGTPTGDVSLTLTAAVLKTSEEPTPTVTPEPDPTPTATPDQKPTPTPTSPATTLEPSEEPTPTVTPEPDPTPTATPDQKPTPTPPTATQEPSEQPTPTVTPEPDPTPTVTPDQKPTPTSPAATLEPSDQPTPTVTPEPDLTPTVTPDQKPTPTPPVATQKPNTAKIEGYDIFAAPCGKKLNAKSLIKTVKGERTSAALARIAGKKITGKKSYKIKIKAYQLVNGKKVYISGSLTYHVAGAKNKTYTNAKQITVSKKSVKLKKGKTSRIKAKIVKQSKKKKLLPKSHGAPLRFCSTDTKIATVTSKGKIRGKKKGTCYIYITALNGVSAKVKITVR